MAKDITSKNMDGTTDLVVVAPIKSGFISAYENVTYATRLRVVAEALNKVRVSAREHETTTPFSDVTERILTLLDFRVGVLDKDVFSFPPNSEHKRQSDGPRGQRYLYLTATFDGAWEPYMRLIWDPLGPFLDLLFCNCEGYVTAADHSFDEYAQWVRDNQVDSAIFYASSGLTIRDHLYLSRLEYLNRSQKSDAQSDMALAQLIVPNPELAAQGERRKALIEVSQLKPEAYKKIHELALEALTVLYRLADFYPPNWLMKPTHLREGLYLARVAHSLLAGWEELIPKTPGPLLDDWKANVLPYFGEILDWFESGKKHIEEVDQKRLVTRPPDPAFNPTEVQAGILKAHGSAKNPVRTGALLMLSIRQVGAARKFLKRLDVDYGLRPASQPDGSQASKTMFTNVAFTAHGLHRIGLENEVLNHFPKEFREGMEVRSGLLGDMRESHPRNWTLPARNWPPLTEAQPSLARPPIELSEVDVVIQLRSTRSDEDLSKFIADLAKRAQPGFDLLGVEWMETNYVPAGNESVFTEHFGFTDGISQPKAISPYTPIEARKPDETALGEIILGYRNDRDDFAPEPFGSFDQARARQRDKALALQKDGTFLVIRKLEQHVTDFNAFIDRATADINAAHVDLSPPMTKERLKAKILGRWPDGRPLIETPDQSRNNFDYQSDPKGEKCPFASHVRRTNPRDSFQGRKAPRLLRRGMLFGGPEGSDKPKGLMFMAYNASIAEQFETIQRWINGGNSTGVASAHADPLMAVAPKSGAQSPTQRSFRFIDGGKVIRVTMPQPFVTLHWGQYLFVPSRRALSALCKLTAPEQIMEAGDADRGQAVIDRLGRVTSHVQIAGEWKRILEDFDIKDPAERAITPDVWAAIRKNHGGVLRILPARGQKAPADFDWNVPPDETTQGVILCAARDQVMGVLKDWKAFSTEEQLRRATQTVGSIYVAQQPNDKYKNKSLQGITNYRDEGLKTNQILMEYDENWGFEKGYAAGQVVLKRAIDAAKASRRRYFKLELRRQFLLPALGALCNAWYGIPDGVAFALSGWQWTPPSLRKEPAASCPGDFLSPSRYSFYPRPTPTVAEFALAHGPAILNASRAFVARLQSDPSHARLGPIAAEMAKVTPDPEILARNLIGTLVGAIPPMDGNLRGIIAEWLGDKSLWRHQTALRRALHDRPANTNIAAAIEVLKGPVSQAMCKRPAPDLVYRTARKDTKIKTDKETVRVKEGDLLVVSLVAAAQQSLEEHPETGDVSIVFGGKRTQADQIHAPCADQTVHACPAQKLALGAVMGILAALLDAGRIQALPASMIVKISGDWLEAEKAPTE